MSDIRAQISVGSSAECMDADVNNTKSPVDMGSRYQQSEEFDDRCIILIQLFGGYSISKVLHVRTTLEKCCMQELHVQTTLEKCCMQEMHVRTTLEKRCMQELYVHMQ